MPELLLPNGKFAPGNPGNGGIPGPGRHSNKALREIERARDTVLRMLRKDIKKIGRTYIALAAGEAVETEKGKIELKVDPPTTRHAIERLIPAARQEIDLNVGLKIVRINAFLPDSEDTTGSGEGR